MHDKSAQLIKLTTGTDREADTWNRPEIGLDL